MFGHILKPRLGGRGIMIEPLKRLAPPCQTDRAKRWLGRTRDNFGHDIVDSEQCIERGPKLDRPVQPDEITIPHLNDT